MANTNLECTFPVPQIASPFWSHLVVDKDELPQLLTSLGNWNWNQSILNLKETLHQVIYHFNVNLTSMTKGFQNIENNCLGHGKSMGNPTQPQPASVKCSCGSRIAPPLVQALRKAVRSSWHHRNIHEASPVSPLDYPLVNVYQKKKTGGKIIMPIMGKFTVSMAMFNSKLLNYQRVLYYDDL